MADHLNKHLATLKREGTVSVWYDREIRAGSEWKRDIASRLEQAEVILLLISPDFLASDYCYGLEMKRALERHESGEAWVIPIILRPTSWSTSPFSKLQALPKDGRPVSTWKSLDSAFGSITEGIKQVISNTRLTTGRPDVSNDLPAPPALFVNREKELQQLRDLLVISPTPATGSTVILTGMGGVGKTVLAAQYARRYAGTYKVVWWANANEPAALAESMARLATEIGIAERGETDQRELARAAKRWLERTSRWLLVLDDVRDADQIDPYFPSEHRGHVIIVSRSRDWTGRGTVLNLLAFGREESVQFLRICCKRLPSLW